MPSVKSRIPWEGGGYLVRTNAAGFRSDHELTPVPCANTFCAILFGGSQTAGDGCANGDRYSDIVESLMPNIEVFNYGLPATGTDQHYLTYLDFADVDHDLLIIGLHVENIGRVAHRFYPFLDSDGKEVIYAKPYYSIEHGELVLHHVPVPKATMTKTTISADDAPYVDWVCALRRASQRCKVGTGDLVVSVGA